MLHWFGRPIAYLFNPRDGEALFGDIVQRRNQMAYEYPKWHLVIMDIGWSLLLFFDGLALRLKYLFGKDDK